MDKSEINRTFGRNLKEIRESRRQTHNAFAASIDGFASTLQSYEGGAKLPTFHRFCKLFNVLNVSPNRLLDGLFPWVTELETIHALDASMNTLHGIKRHQVERIQDDFIKCATETPPILSGTSFGNRLYALRLDAGLDVASLAGCCSISKSTLQGYESGQFVPSLPVLLHLSKALRVSPEYLLFPEVKLPACRDERIMLLKPRQISALLSITQKLTEALGD